MKTRSLFQGALALLLLAAFGHGLLRAQEVDYDEEQYKQYTEAVNEPDLAQREVKIVEFIKAHPNLSLVKYATQSLREVVNTYYQQQKWPDVIRAAETWLKLEPDASAAHGLIADAAFQTQDFGRVAQHGEKFYETNPSPQMAYVLAITFQQLKSNRFQKYGELAVAGFEPEDYFGGHFQILAQLRGMAATSGDWSGAAQYARKILEGFDKAQLQEGWQSYIAQERPLCYAVLGRASYENGRWSEAISNYQKVVSSSSDKNIRAEGYYYIGVANWKANKLDPAMESFARGSMLTGAPHQDACDQYLIKLYKSTHNDTIAGLDEYKQRVTSRP